MIRLHTLAASTLLAALTLLPATAPRADFSISVTSGSALHLSNGHRDRGFRQRHQDRRHDDRRHHDRRDHRRGHGQDGHSRHHGSRIIIVPHGYGVPGRHAFGSGCRTITERARDRFGRLVLLHRTLCYDRSGRPYVLGGPH
jgi:hypothetical protein